MEKRALHTPDLAARNIERIAELFPTVMTESHDPEGNVITAVDFDLLRQELSDHDRRGAAGTVPPRLARQTCRSPNGERADCEDPASSSRGVS
ncbi:MAG: hypothetical protein V9F04_12505 [Dermatophilaceae bacterium]